MTAFLFLVLSVCATIPVVASEEDEPKVVSSSYSWGVILGMIIGGGMPLLLLQVFHNGDNGPPSAIRQLTPNNFFGCVGKSTPAVILLHSGTNNDCQEFRWTFEEIFEHFQKQRGKAIFFGTVDEDSNSDLLGPQFAARHIKGQPTMLWFGPKSTSPIFYSSSILEAKKQWLIAWIEKRYQKSLGGNNQLQMVEEVIGQIYHWLDGYDTSEAEQLKIDETVETKSMMSRLFSGHDASVYGEVLPEGIESWIDQISTYQGQGLQKADVLYDLGCGTGKVVVQLALVTPCKKVAGIELSETRYRHGINALKKAKTLHEQALVLSKHTGKKLPPHVASLGEVVQASNTLRLHLYKGDVSKPVFMDGTHLFAASTTWPGSLLVSIMSHLTSPKSTCKTFATLRPLTDEEIRPFIGKVSKWKTISVAVSWQDHAPLHIYHFPQRGVKRD